MNSRNSIAGGPGLIRAAGRNGVVLTPYQRKRLPFRYLAKHPFQVLAVDGAAKVTVAYGTVTGGGLNIVPTIGGTSIATTPAPELTVVTGTVYLKATVDGAGLPTACVVENAASTPTDTANEKHRTIAAVSVSGTVVSVTRPQSVISSLTLYVCGGSAIWEQA